MTRSATPVLWQYTFSNFNEKARWALDFKAIEHERRSLVPGSPRALLFSHRGTVPVLDFNGERIADSTRIIEALERYRPNPPMYPADSARTAATLGFSSAVVTIATLDDSRSSERGRVEGKRTPPPRGGCF